MNSIERFWRAIGGRKMALAMLYAALLTWAATRVDPFPFESYAMWLAGALLTTSGIVAAEDRAKSSRPAGARRASDPVTP